MLTPNVSTAAQVSVGVLVRRRMVCRSDARLMNMSVVEPQKQSVIDAIDALERVLQTLPPGASNDKALYHLGRLRIAVAASHQEGVRFAAFTINKTIHDAGSSWDPAALEAMTTLRGALHAAGHEF